MTVSIIIPAYREHESLAKNVPYLAARFPSADIHIIENGSNIAPDLHFLDNVRSSRLDTKGLGVALKFGICTAKQRVVVFLPADLSYDLRFVNESEAIIRAGWDLVIGSKRLHLSHVERPLLRQIISELYNGWYNARYDLKVRDITGTKAYNRDTICPMLDSKMGNGIDFEVNLLRAMRRLKMRIMEIPVTVRDYNASKFVPWQVSR